ncbi:MAG: flagellar basal body L-ring protein FlgH [Synergistaceae bacterium]|jgi:flagellar L-ring protein precursor FlgH|nr:flagellar basal body L-ring protein FlgH [Synergistaceae bacterium]
MSTGIKKIERGGCGGGMSRTGAIPPSLRVALIALAILLAASLPAGAESLWSDSSSLFSDRKASGIGDVIMVKVSEKTDDSDEGQISSSKTTDEDVRSGFGILNFLRAFGFGSASSASSNTTVERKKELTATISCLVVDVLPNGNMVIQGDRFLTSGAEKMNLRFEGVVRPQDVTHDNTVESSRVANAMMTVTGKGIISRTQRPGLINQIIQAIF